MGKMVRAAMAGKRNPAKKARRAIKISPVKSPVKKVIKIRRASRVKKATREKSVRTGKNRRITTKKTRVVKKVPTLTKLGKTALAGFSRKMLT
jgi:hypothetical protein